MYVNDTTEQTPAHSNTSVDPISHSVIVPSPLQTAEDPEHGGKQDCHHDGSVGAASSDQVMEASICWHDWGMTRGLNAPWHMGTGVPHADAFEQNSDAPTRSRCLGARGGFT